MFTKQNLNKHINKNAMTKISGNMINSVKFFSILNMLPHSTNSNIHP